LVTTLRDMTSAWREFRHGVIGQTSRDMLGVASAYWHGMACIVWNEGWEGRLSLFEYGTDVYCLNCIIRTGT